jgi:predicted TIM-barrel fold metal-dependent hydrolase
MSGAATPLSGAIDLHAHYLPTRYREAALAHGQDRPDGMPALPEWSEGDALAMMDAVGIAAAALSISSPGVGFLPPAERPALARAVNGDGAATVGRHPDRFALLATLPLPDVDASLAEITRAYDALGADGIGVHTHVDGVYLGDARLDPVMAALDERAAVVAIHPVSPCGWEQTAFGRPRPMLEFLFDTTRAVVNLTLSRVLTRYPHIYWVVPHAGAALSVVSDRVDRINQMLSGDPDPVDVIAALGTVYFDLAGMPLPRALPALLSLVGPDRLVYGSDYPFTGGPVVAGLAGLLAASPLLAEPVAQQAFRTTALGLLPRLAALAG